MDDNIKIPTELLEVLILTYSLHNISFFLKVKTYLTTSNHKKKSYFNDVKNQLIFNILSHWYDKFHSFPVKKEMEMLLDKVNEDADVKLYLKSMINKYYTEDVSGINEQNLIEEAQDFITQNRLIEAIALSQGDMDSKNYGAIVDKVRDAITINFDKDLGLSTNDYDNAIDVMTKELSDLNAITTGFPSFDRYGIKLYPSEVVCLSGIPKIGKSNFLGNIAINVYEQGKNVLVYTFETSTTRLLSRYYSNMIGMKGSEIQANPEEAKERLKKRLELIQGELIIKEYGANIACSNDLMAHINDLQMYKKWKPDLIVIDYLLIMRPNDPRLSPEDKYTYYKKVAEEVRNISKFYKIPVLTASQLNRESMDERGGSKALTTSKNISESRGILDTVDYFITINQTARDKKAGEVMLYIDANRNGPSGEKIYFDIDYDYMRITEKKNDGKNN